MSSPTLKRCISLPALIFYGLGTILGAGIYVLVGKVAGEAGMFAPIAFVVAAVLAAFTGLSFAELSARYPKSAGVVAYIDAAFKNKLLSKITGYLIILTGIVSAGTLSNGFTGYLDIFVEIPSWFTITGIVALMGAVAFWGISQSVKLAVLITLIETGGLILIIVLAGNSLALLPENLPNILPSSDFSVWGGIFLGAFLAFYAFIGFEDMVNTAEEIKNPRKNLPLAIIITIIISTILYIVISLIAVLALPLDELIQSDAPLATILAKKGPNLPFVISAISLIAVINGALVQIIMASRMLYGMGKEGVGFKIFSKIHPKTRTPWVATIVITLLIIIVALWFPLVTLAKATSFIIIIIFTLVNLALIILKLKLPHPEKVPLYPILIPILGVIFSVGFLGFQITSMA